MTKCSYTLRCLKKLFVLLQNKLEKVSATVSAGIGTSQLALKIKQTHTYQRGIRYDRTDTLPGLFIPFIYSSMT